MNNRYFFSAKTYLMCFILCTLAIATLLLLPAVSFSSMPKFILWKNSDKVVHTLMFFCQAYLLHRCLELKTKINFKKIGYVVVLAIFFFGLITEILQGITYNTAKRNFSLYDLLFDTIGAALSVLLIYLLDKKLKNKRLI